MTIGEQTYQTAHEDEKVTVSNFTLAEGKEVDGVWYRDDDEDESKQVKAADGAWGTNDDGSIWVRMLRGGGMRLGLILKDKAVQPEPQPEPEPEPQPEPEPAPKPAAASSAVKLVEVQDAENRITIAFMSNGTFKASMEDKSTEKGTFRNENGRLVLACGSSSVTVGEDGTFTYTSQKNAGLTYAFTLGPADMQALLKAAK